MNLEYIYHWYWLSLACMLASFGTLEQYKYRRLKDRWWQEFEPSSSHEQLLCSLHSSLFKLQALFDEYCPVLGGLIQKFSDWFWLHKLNWLLTQIPDPLQCTLLWHPYTRHNGFSIVQNLFCGLRLILIWSNSQKSKQETRLVSRVVVKQREYSFCYQKILLVTHIWYFSRSNGNTFRINS